MAGGKFSLANLFGITLRESANDGSDFTNPDADYRRLFLGEDAALHLKDSAGTVTTIGGGGSGTAAMNQLGADVTMTNANQFYDGPSLSLLAGTYVITAVVTINNASAGGNRVTIKIWDGTTVGASSQATNSAVGTVTEHTAVCYVVIGSTATWKVSAAANLGGDVMLAAANTNGAGNNACTLVALKIA